MKTKTKKLLFLVLSLALVFSCLAIVISASSNEGAEEAEDKIINVWLIAGQSNAVGYGTAAEYPDGYDGDILDAGISNVLFYGKGYGNDCTNFAPVTFGLGKSEMHSGPEIGIATALKDSGEKHVIIKYASGDTQLSATKVTADNNIATWTPPSYIASNSDITFEGDKIGDLYDGFISTVEEAVAQLKAEGYTPVIQGFWWMQGERDSNLGSMTADLYSTLLKALISDVRQDVGTIMGEDLSDMPAVFGRVYRNPNDAPLSEVGLAAVQAGQDAVAADATLTKVAMLDTRYELTDPESGEAKALVQQDGWHYDALTQQMIGEAFIRKTNAFKSAPNGVYIEGYGTIPADKSDAGIYPIVLFQGGEIKGVYGKAEFKSAYKTAHDLTTSRGAPTAKILLRGDAEFEGTAYADKVGSSFGEIDINLGGHTLTHTGTSFVFYLRMLSHTSLGETFTLGIRNGNIASTNYVLFGVGAMYDGSDTSVKLTDVDINMTDVNIKVSDNKGWNSGPIFYNQGSTNNSDDKEMKINLTMTDCTLDLSGMKKASAIFDTTSSHVASDGSKIHAFNIEINGGEIIVGNGTENVRPYASKLYTLNDYSSIKFGKGTDGEYLKLTVPADVTASILTNTPFYTDEPITAEGSDGAEAEFINPKANGELITYSLQSDVFIEGYGTVPKEYGNSNTYPIVLFQNGTFIGAYAKTDFTAAYKAAHDLTTTSDAPTARILLCGNAEFSGTAYADKVGSSFGEIDINLGGYTLTHTGSSFIFYLRMLSHTTKGETFTLGIRNGNMIANYVIFGVGAMYDGSDASVKLTNVDINMTDVNVIFNAKGWNSGPIFYNQGTTNNADDKKIEFDLTMTDCTLDLSAMTKANAIFDTTSSHVATSSGVLTKAHAFDIVINGGELIVGKGNNSGTNPYASKLYTLNDYSSITFGKGSDGNYLKLTVPGDVTASIVNGKVTLDNGAECIFVKASADGDNTTYQLYPEVMVGYKIKSSVTLCTNLVYNIYVPATNALSAVNINGEGAILDENMITEIDGAAYYRIPVSLAVADSLNDIELSVALTSGEATVNAKWTLNIVNYAKKILDGDSSDVEKALVRDMLSYAASAHTYFKTTEAVADKLAEITSILGESYDANNKVTVSADAAKQPDDDTYFTSVSIYLGEVPSFRFYLASGYEADDFTFTVGGKRTQANPVDTNGDGNADCLEIVMYAYMMLDDVSYTVVNKDTNGTVTENYNLYAYYKYASSLTGDAANLVSIVERLMKYAASSNVYRKYVTDYHEHSFNSTVKAEATAFTRGTLEYKCTFCGYAYTEVIPTTLKILAVGNSFSTDAMEHLYLVAKDAGIENVVLGNLYIGSCSISTHLTKMNNDAADYTFYISDDAVGGMVKEGTRTAKYGITYTDWDYITVQQSSANSGLGETFADLQSVIDYINGNKTSDAEILWHMTWAYQQNSTHSGFANYNNSQTAMYNSIVAAVNEHILTNSDISGVIPSGTSIQNLRTSPLGDTLTRDGHHLSYGIGRYTAALTWLAAVTGYDIDEITAAPTSYPEVADNLGYIKEAVREAIANPYSVIRSNVVWEMGTIASKDGMNSDTNNTNRMRTVEYLSLSDIASVTANEGYMLLWFAYDEDKNWLGKLGTWASEGTVIYTDDIANSYTGAVYFRIAMRRGDGATMTMDKDLEKSGVAFSAAEAESPEEQPLELKYERLMNIGACQDGAIWNKKLFALNSKGTGSVYDLKTLTRIGTFTLDASDVLKPHANSVCFGNTYYEDGDKYPLLYANVYNNYQSSSDRMEGTCCVYRITELDGSFTTALVQVIRIGFTEDLTLWKSIADNGDARPYGNFFIDTDNNKLYAYVMRDADKTTAFFNFDVPELSDGVYNDTYGCNLVTLEKTDIKHRFDTEYVNYMQGVTYTGGKIISLEGFKCGDSRGNPVLKIIDLSAEAVIATYYLENYDLTEEPEMVSVDYSANKLYYASLDGELGIIEISGV